jgi:hypothetical protein
MPHSIRRQAWVLIFIPFILILLAILAAGFGSVEFDQPRNGGLDDFLNRFGNFKSGEDADAAPFWGKIIYWAILIILFLVMLGPVRPQTTKNLFQQLVRFFSMAAVVLLFLGYFARKQESMDQDQTLVTSGESTSEAQVADSLAFTRPEVDNQLELIITIVVVVVLVGLGAFLIHKYSAHLFRSRESQPLDEIAAAAQVALDDLASGKEWQDAIIGCYVRMNISVGIRRGMEREPDMTPSEFAQHLEQAGLPGGAVGRLTRLFERVRYGVHEATQADIQEAVNCLTEVVQACGENL